MGRGKLFNQDILLLKPQTFMNLSGESVREIVSYFKIEIEDILVIYDDMALEPGRIRLRPSGSSGGHKGMQNIIEHLGTEDINNIATHRKLEGGINLIYFCITRSYECFLNIFYRYFIANFKFQAVTFKYFDSW